MKYRVSKKNVGLIMDRVNRFLSRSTVLDEGIHNVRTGYQTVKWPGGICAERVPIYEMRQVFTPFINGSCHWHRIYKSEGDIGWFGHKNPILAISSNLQSSCIPLYEGNLIEINSTRMRIISFSPNDRELKLSPSEKVFLNAPVSEAERETTIMNALKEMFFDYLYEDFDWIEDYDERRALRDTLSMVISKFEDAIESESDGLVKFSITNKDLIETIGCEGLSTPIQCEVDIKNFPTNGVFTESYIIDGDKEENVINLVLRIYDNYIYEEEDEDEDDNDYDEYDIYNL